MLLSMMVFVYSNASASQESAEVEKVDTEIFKEELKQHIVHLDKPELQAFSSHYEQHIAPILKPEEPAQKEWQPSDPKIIPAPTHTHYAL
jgi:hypothetical protein